MEILHCRKGLWDIVIGAEVTPTEGTADQKEKFDKCPDVAVTNLLHTIDDTCLSSMIILRDPTRMWHTLMEIFKATSESCINSYLARYQQILLRSSEKLVSYMNCLKELEKKLAEIGHNFQTRIDAAR